MLTRAHRLALTGLRRSNMRTVCGKARLMPLQRAGGVAWLPVTHKAETGCRRVSSCPRVAAGSDSTPSSSTFLQEALAHHDFGAAHEAWLRMCAGGGAVADGMSTHLAAYMQSLVAHGRGHEALAVFQSFVHDCEDNNSVVHWTPQALAATVSACVIAGETTIALQYWAEAIDKQKVVPDLACFDALLDVHGARKDWRACLQTLEQVYTHFAAPPEATYVRTMAGCVQGTTPYTAMTVFDDMCRRGVSPTLKSFSTLMDAAADAADVDLAKELITIMDDRNTYPDHAILSSAIRAATSAGHVQQAAQYLQDMREWGISPELLDYERCVRSACKRGDTALAESLVGIMHEDGVQKTPLTWRWLVHGYLMDGDLAEAVSLAQQPLEPGKEELHARVVDVAADIVRFMDSAIHDEEDSSGISSDEEEADGDDDGMSAAETAFNALLPVVQTYGAHGWASVTTLRHATELVLSVGLVDEGLDLLRTMHAVHPHALHAGDFNKLLLVCREDLDIGTAQSVLGFMQEAGVRPNRETMLLMAGPEQATEEEESQSLPTRSEVVQKLSVLSDAQLRQQLQGNGRSPSGSREDMIELLADVFYQRFGGEDGEVGEGGQSQDETSHDELDEFEWESGDDDDAPTVAPANEHPSHDDGEDEDDVVSFGDLR